MENTETSIFLDFNEKKMRYTRILCFIHDTYYTRSRTLWHGRFGATAIAQDNGTQGR